MLSRFLITPSSTWFDTRVVTIAAIALPGMHSACRCGQHMHIWYGSSVAQPISPTVRDFTTLALYTMDFR